MTRERAYREESAGRRPASGKDTPHFFARELRADRLPLIPSVRALTECFGEHHSDGVERAWMVAGVHMHCLRALYAN